MSDKISKCCSCGYEWKTGTNGSHSCTEKLRATIRMMLDNDGIDGAYKSREFFMARDELRKILPKT